MQAFLEGMTTGLERLGLLHEKVGSQDDTITYDIGLTPLEDARGYRAKHILLTFELQCMSRIRTTLETSHHIILRGEHINNLTFSFVAPLQTQQDINFTLIHCFLSFFLVLSLFFQTGPAGGNSLTRTTDAIDVERKAILVEALGTQGLNGISHRL